MVLYFSIVFGYIVSLIFKMIPEHVMFLLLIMAVTVPIIIIYHYI